MRISWRELDWISERDRTEIERRMHILGGASGLLDRVDFAGRSASAADTFEIRITANAAKRQIIAIRRDSQRVKAFNSAFEALERSVVSVLKNAPSQPPQPRNERAVEPRPAAVSAALPALRLPESSSWLQSWVVRRGVRAALAGGLAAAVLLWFWVLRAPRQADVGAGREPAAFSAVAQIPVQARNDVDPAFSAVAHLMVSDR